jgi:4-hydroxythreonine-4-phosphate dehydrogenase
LYLIPDHSSSAPHERPINVHPPADRPLIALTQGDPAGIGPELCLKVIADPNVLAACVPVIVGDRSVLAQVAERLNLALPAHIFDPETFLDPATTTDLDQPALVDCAVIDQPIQPGKPTRIAGEASYRYIQLAIQAALAGIVGGVATAPITKTTINMAGIKEPGHTEVFGRLTGCDNFAMMLYSPRIAVSFVTCHQSLRSVPSDLSVEAIRRVTDLTGRTLRRIRGREPHLAVLGLNPHAGEDGIFGREEIDIVAPAVQLARADGWDVEGPVPPDAAFMPHALKRIDGHVTLYHDQGSIPFKMISMHDGVNITMGLPIVRTSVDHGTAYDIAWQGKASHSSYVSAIELAAKLASEPGKVPHG